MTDELKVFVTAAGAARIASATTVGVRYAMRMGRLRPVAQAFTGSASIALFEVEEVKRWSQVRDGERLR